MPLSICDITTIRSIRAFAILIMSIKNTKKEVARCASLVSIGVDVGGTNTDAVFLDGNELMAKYKTTTTSDITTGIITAIHPRKSYLQNNHGFHM